MIELKNIYKTYHIGAIEVKAVQGVSLSIKAGEFVAIMGASGSGKSTLMHLMGLLDRPDSGEYLINGHAVGTLNDEQMAVLRNRIIGFVFQQFHLLPRMTAFENAKLPLIYSEHQSVDETKVVEKLSSVGLSDRVGHRPNELSGGQQQRVAIARALVNDPLIILADEPTGNLDTKSKDEVMSILQELHGQGKTVVMVTHEPDMALYAQRVIQMRDGVVISDERREISATSKGTKVDLAAVPTTSIAFNNQLKILDSARQAITAMLAHKMRSFLSILGILIGVGAVIAMLALGSGAQASVKEQLSSLGSNLLIVRPGSPRVGGVAMQSGTVTRLTIQDVQSIGQLTATVKEVSGSVSGRAQLVYGSKNWNTQLEGVDVAFETMRSSQPVAGRFFSEEEYRTRDKVVLVGTTVARELFNDENPVGKTMKINLINFRVIGVLPQKGSNTFRDQDDTVIIPLTTAMFRVLGKEYVDSVYVEAVSAETMDEAETAIEDLLIKRHHLRGDEARDSFQIRNMSDLKAALESTTKTMSWLLGSIAAISLLVGGIGIMNIMLVSVSERTREIGLRKAIGATQKDIMVQFLVESVLMSIIGGLAGVCLGVSAAVLITIFAGWSVKVSVFSILLATVFSFFVGLVFGLGPAYKASLLNPIEALRYE